MSRNRGQEEKKNKRCCAGRLGNENRQGVQVTANNGKRQMNKYAIEPAEGAQLYTLISRAETIQTCIILNQ